MRHEVVIQGGELHVLPAVVAAERRDSPEQLAAFLERGDSGVFTLRPLLNKLSRLFAKAFQRTR